MNPHQDDKDNAGDGPRRRTPSTPLIATESWHRVVTVLCLLACLGFTALGALFLWDPPKIPNAHGRTVCFFWILVGVQGCHFLVRQLLASFFPATRRRMNYFVTVIFTVLIVLGAGYCGAFNHFPAAALSAVTDDPQVVLYSLDPSQGPASREASAPIFHDYPILGQTVLDRAEDRQRVADHLSKATRGAFGQAACFNPRHGLRATDRSGTFDILLCFECRQAVVFRPDGERQMILIRGPATTLDELLTAAHISLGKRR